MLYGQHILYSTQKLTNHANKRRKPANLKKRTAYLREIFGVKRIRLFGSYSKGTQGEDSDVDLIVEFEKPIGLKFVELADHIEKTLGKKTDILTPAGINSIRIKNIADDIKRNTIYV